MKTAPQKFRTIPVQELKPHPENPREGDIGAIHTSIEKNGFYGAIVVQKSTGYVLAGNHRLQAAIHAGATKIPAFEVDVDDEAAKRILLADNRTNDLASYDDDALARLLSELIRTPDGLAGTGYEGDDLDALLSDLDESAPTDFPTVSPTIETSYRCPSCGYEWSGSPKPETAESDASE